MLDIKKVSGNFTKSVVKIVIYIILLIVLYLIGFTAYKYGQRVFSEKGLEPAPGKDIYVTIPEGASKGDVASLLESYGLVEDSFIFKLQLTIYKADDIKAGEYTLNTSQSGEKMISILTGQDKNQQNDESETGKNNSKSKSKSDKSKDKNTEKETTKEKKK